MKLSERERELIREGQQALIIKQRDFPESISKRHMLDPDAKDKQWLALLTRILNESERGE